MLHTSRFPHLAQRAQQTAHHLYQLYVQAAWRSHRARTTTQQSTTDPVEAVPDVPEQLPQAPPPAPAALAVAKPADITYEGDLQYLLDRSPKVKLSTIKVFKEGEAKSYYSSNQPNSPVYQPVVFDEEEGQEEDSAPQPAPRPRPIARTKPVMEPQQEVVHAQPMLLSTVARRRGPFAVATPPAEDIPAPEPSPPPDVSTDDQDLGADDVAESEGEDSGEVSADVPGAQAPKEVVKRTFRRVQQAAAAPPPARKLLEILEPVSGRVRSAWPHASRNHLHPFIPEEVAWHCLQQVQCIRLYLG